VQFFFVEFEKILTQEGKRLNYNPSPEEISAGFEKFRDFGEFPTLLSLSKTLNKTIEQVLETDYNTIFITLAYEAQAGNYRDKLNKILSK
jgi:hypothetical protein